MQDKITAKKITKNVFISITAQVISLLVSVVANLIIPKFIGELEYSHWQTYVLYFSFVSFLHFGLIDGMLLRYAQYDYNEIDKGILRSQFKALLVFMVLLTILTQFVAFTFLTGLARVIVALLGIGIVTKNIFAYTSYTFQMTNQITKYAYLVILQRLLFCIVIVILLGLGVNDFKWYCTAELIGDFLATVVAMLLNPEMYFGKSLKFNEAMKEVKKNVFAGFFLMMATLSSLLLVNSAKMVAQWKWDELTFGKLSLAFSITNLFLTFISAISIVLFPSLKRLSKESLPTAYRKIRGSISHLLLIILLFYFPGCWLIELWLPKYQSSLVYLGVLLPMIVYSSKVNLLTNNYLKAYRKERILLYVNLISLAVGFILFLISAYVFSSLNALLLCIVLTVTGNSIVSEIVVMKLTNISFVKDIIIEIIMSAGFIISVWLLQHWVACAVYASLLLIYAIINWKQIAELLSRFQNRKKVELR